MDYAILALVAFITSALTFFSGFGLGTLLMPVMVFFFPIEIAIGTTAVVHLLNSLFKFFLMRKKTDWSVVFNFGFPAILAAYGGAMALLWLGTSSPFYSWELNGTEYQIGSLNLVIAGLMLFFSLFELIPGLSKISFSTKLMPFGGLLSGFFGGLSGHQGALRSAFLVRYGLDKDRFIATSVVIAAMVDVTRILVYSSRYSVEINAYLLTAIAAAFAGAFLGSRLLKKITLTPIRILIAVLLILIAAGVGAGII